MRVTLEGAVDFNSLTKLPNSLASILIPGDFPIPRLFRYLFPSSLIFICFAISARKTRKNEKNRIITKISLSKNGLLFK